MKLERLEEIRARHAEVEEMDAWPGDHNADAQAWTVELLMEVGRLRAALNTIAKHSDIHSDFPHGTEGLQRFAADALKKE